MNESCPICDPPASCPGYAHLWKRLREDVDFWRPVHDQVVAFAAMDDAVRAAALIAEFPPENPIVPIGRKCCG